MRETVFTAIFLLITGIAAAQAQNLRSFMDSSGKIGFKDANGKIVVPPKYDHVGPFSEGMARVNTGFNLAARQSGKFGFINALGKLVIPIKYESATHFKGGVARVKLDGRYFYIDPTGKDIGPTPPARTPKPSATGPAKNKAETLADMSVVTKTLLGVFDKAVGRWSVTVKDRKFGLPLDYKIEIKNVVNGKAEVWMLEGGVPYKRFNSFEFLNLMGQLRFIFEYSPDGKIVSRGSGSVSRDISRMTGTQLSPMGGRTRDEEWTAQKDTSVASASPAVPARSVSGAEKPVSPGAPSYKDLVGVWAVTTKDQTSGKVSHSSFEIRMVKGTLEAWRVVKGKADLKYTSFKVFDGENGPSFIFELNVPPRLKVEGTGTIDSGSSQMSGIQLLSIQGTSVAFTHQFSARKEPASIASRTSGSALETSRPIGARVSSSNQPKTPAGKLSPARASASLIAAKPFKSGSKYGYRDANGNVAISPIYDHAFDFDENDAAVVFKGDPLTMKGVYGIIGRTGNEIVAIKYAYIGLGHNGVYAFRNADGKMGLINSQGRELVAPVYESIFVDRDGMRAVKLNGKKGFIDNTGKLVVAAEFDESGEFFNGRAAVKKNGKWGLIDATGKTVVPFEYDHAKAFIQGHAAIRSNGKYGFVNESGKLVIDFQFEDTGFFSEGFAFVKKGGKWGYIDTAGKAITEFKYDSNTNYDRFDNGIAIVILNGKRGFIDKTGREIILPQYDNALPFRNGKAKVKINGREFFIDKAGAEVK
ncbi:MAG: WG repeat-containing protein [Pyrinomonadaceae bacterium]